MPHARMPLSDRLAKPEFVRRQNVAIKEFRFNIDMVRLIAMYGVLKSFTNVYIIPIASRSF